MDNLTNAVSATSGQETAAVASGDEGYFSERGYRRLALATLIEVVTTVKREPESEEAAYQREWLLGINEDCPLSSRLCFETIAGSAIDVSQVSRQFVRALDRDPEYLLFALNSAAKKIVDGDLFADGEQEYFVNEAQLVEAERRVSIDA